MSPVDSNFAAADEVQAGLPGREGRERRPRSDFEHQRREEAMQYFYEKYGRDRAALTAVATTYRTKSALRDVSKAMGIEHSSVRASAE